MFDSKVSLAESRPASYAQSLKALIFRLAGCVLFLLALNPDARASVINVPAGGNLQAALNSAAPGDEVILEAGATFTGNYTLPVKSGSSYITVRSSRCSELPANVRVTPAGAPLMARLATPNAMPVLVAPVNSHHWDIRCIEFTQGAAVGSYGYQLIELGEGSTQTTMESVPHHLTFDRCIVRARDAQTAVQRGFTLNSAHTTIKNSYVSDIKWAGVEAQAIGGWNGPGPFLIENNYLEAAGMGILFGGAKVGIPGLVPSDVMIRGNVITKPSRWRKGDPSWDGSAWTVKNCFELKNARRVTFTGNRCENSWPDAQTGWAVIFNAGVDPTIGGVIIEDVEVSANTFVNSSNGLNIKGMENDETATRTRRVNVHDNLFENVGAFNGEGKSFQVLNGTENVFINHNTVRQEPRTARYGASLILDGVGGVKHAGLQFTNNLLPFGEYGVFGNGGTVGADAMNAFAYGWALTGNAFVAAPEWAKAKLLGNYFPATEAGAAGLLGTDGTQVGARGSTTIEPTPTPSPTATPTPAPTPTPTATPTPTPSPTPTSSPTPSPTPVNTLTTSITSPLSGAQFDSAANVTITAVAADTAGVVSKVEFYAGTQLLGTDTAAPYGCAWNNVAAGTYYLTAKATDNAGRSAVSGEVKVIIKKSTATVGRAKKNAQTTSNQLSELTTSSQLSESTASSSVEGDDSLLAQVSVAPRLADVASDIQQAYDDFVAERDAYAAAARIESELQNALNYARSAEALARGGNVKDVAKDVKSALRTAIDYLELANVHMLHGDVPNPAAFPEFFVRQHYVDFLNREPDEDGLRFWAGEIANCGEDAQCVQVKRVNVSAAFFLSIESRETGFLVYRLHRASYGRMPLLSELRRDAEEISRGLIVGKSGWEQKLEANKADFYRQWVRRPEFTEKYGSLTNGQYVDALISRTGAAVNPEERSSWVATLDAGSGRDSVLRQVTERKEFVDGELSSAFVMMEYMGYLRRDPDAGGYNHWLGKLNEFGGDYVRAEMVKAFLESIEYNQRFTSR